MAIWVDADACPNVIKEILFRAAERVQMPLTLVGRLEAFPEEGQRPALTSRPLSEEVSEVLAERDALYREAAHHVVDASASPEEVVIQIITALRLACAS